MTVEKACEKLLEALDETYGIVPFGDDNFKDTPARMARMYAEILNPALTAKSVVARMVQKTFPCRSGEMVVVRGVRTVGLCPHHMLPVDYRVAAAYIPEAGGRVIGLSKLPRIIDLLCRKPVLQESFVGDVADALMDIEGCRGAACYAEGRHYCMILRGVRQHESETVASALRGIFNDEPAARAEFLELARKD